MPSEIGIKHEVETAKKFHAQMLELCEQEDLGKTLKENLQSSITCYNNHQHQMNYAQFRQKFYPIGSGVTEVAYKTLIKQRLSCSGMHWKEKGASVILSLRAVVLTSTRWG